MFPGAWMAWNLALAAMPLLLARTLFAPDRRPSPRWWFGVVLFVALLPNAPYVLTDIVHFDDAVRASESNLWVLFAIVPAYTALLGCGFACYVLSVVRLERWLRAQGWTLPQLLGADITVHALCAVGVFLGRVFRFNSWDLLARPHDVAAAFQMPEARSVAILAGLFAVLALGTAGLRISLGIRVRTPSNS